MAVEGTTSLERWVKGTEEVLKNLNREIAKIEGKISAEGMHTCLLLLEREAKLITPVGPGKKTQKIKGFKHTGSGNLVGSYSIEVQNVINAIIGILSNNAEYALFVHEFPETYHYNKPGTGPKFVEKPLKANQRKFLDILARTARIK